MRNVDPDNEHPQTGNYTTSNYVAFQPGTTGNPDKAIVVAEGLMYGAKLQLGATDSRAIVSTEGFSNRDPDDILDSPVAPSESSPVVFDHAIAIAFREPSLAPGDSTTFTFKYFLNANQSPSVSAADATGAVTEDTATPDLTTSGTITFDDPDLSDVHTTSVVKNSGTLGGALTATITDPAAEAGNGTVGWDYSVPNSATQYLAAGQMATEQFTVTIDDGAGGTTGQVVTLTITGVNDLPVAVNDTVSVHAGNAIDIDVLADNGNGSDIDVDNDLLTIVEAAPDIGYTLDISGNTNVPTIKLSNNSATAEIVSLTFTIGNTEKNFDSAGAIVANGVTYNLISPDANGSGGVRSNQVEFDFTGGFTSGTEFQFDVDVDQDSANTVENYAAVFFNNGAAIPNSQVTVGFSDGSVLTSTLPENPLPVTAGLYRFSQQGTPQNGSVVINPNQTVTYTPNPGFSGTDTFLYLIEDVAGARSSASVTVDVTNEAPVATDDTASTDEDVPVTISLSELLLNDDDPDEDPLTINAAPDVAYTLEIGGNTNVPTFSLTNGSSEASAAEITSLLFTIGDTSLNFDYASGFVANGVSFTLQDPDTANSGVRSDQIALDFTAGFARGTVFQFQADVDPDSSDQVRDYRNTFFNNDTAPNSQITVGFSDGTVLTTTLPDDPVFDTVDNVYRFSQQTAPQNGAVVLNDDQTITYTPAPDFNGTDRFIYTINDGNGGTDSAEVVITVASVADAPTVLLGANDAATGIEAQGAATQVNTYTTGDQTSSRVAALPDGGFIVTWHSDGQDGDSWGVYAQRYGADFNPAGDEFRVNTTTMGATDAEGIQKDPAISVGPNGGFVIVWGGEDSTQGGSAGIYGQAYDSNGAPLGNEFRVDPVTDTSSSQRWPTVAFLKDGSFVVTYDSRNNASDFEVLTQRFDTNQQKVGGPVIVNSTTQHDQYAGNVVALTDGGYVVTWHSNLQDNITGRGIYAQRFDANGADVGSEFGVNTTTLDDQSYAKVAALSNGGFAIGWSSNNQDGDGYGSYLRLYGADGVAATGEIQVNSTTTGDQWLHPLAPLDDGLLVSYSGGLAQRFDNQGNPVAGEFNLAGGAAVLLDGRLAVVNNADGVDGSGRAVTVQEFAFSKPHDTIIPLNLSVTADDPANETISLTLTGMPAGSTLSAGTDTSAGYGTAWSLTPEQLSGLQLTPPAWFIGKIELRVDATATDNTSSNTATTTRYLDLVITNQAPTANHDGVSPDPVYRTDADTIFDSVLDASGNSVLDNDTDPEDDPLMVVEVNADPANIGSPIRLPSGALLTLNDDGTFVYNPNGAFDSLDEGDEAAIDTFSYTVSDDFGGFDTATVTITIDGVNDAPVAQDDPGTLLLNGGFEDGFTDWETIGLVITAGRPVRQRPDARHLAGIARYR